MVTIAELPFREKPVLELLHLVEHRTEPDPDFAEYGWARTACVWLVEPGGVRRSVDDALVLGLHCPDDGDALVDDIELYFEVPGRGPVTVLASMFFARWLPRLPDDASAIVLALCNPTRASLRTPPATSLPLHFAHGDVESWIAHGDGRIELRAGSWHTAAVTE